ncbi:MAG: iron-sulfur cluster assembly protein [Bdellovibrionota bacterium]
MVYTQPVTSAAVLDALRKVTDPGSGRDLVSLGLVANVRVQGDKVSFDVYVPSHAVGHTDAMRASCVAAVKAIPGVGAVMPNLFQKPKPRVVHGQQAVPGVNHVRRSGQEHEQREPCGRSQEARLQSGPP